jgi:hypothetical protein
MATNEVAPIIHANKTAEGCANRSRLDFQFGSGDGVLISQK